MSTDNPTPGDTAKPTLWQKAQPWLKFVAMVLPALTFLAGALGCPRVVEVFKEVEKIVPVVLPAADGDGGYTPVTGWVPDEDQIADNLDGAKTLQFESTPAGKAVMGDDDVFLWRALRKAAKLNDKQYPNVNQGGVGCCVGCGWKHCADVCQATAIAGGSPFDFKPVSVEAIYGGSRIDVGRGRISGDGSVGAWAKEYVQNRAGIAAMQKYQTTDLTAFSPARAREWGRRGVPADVAAAAKEHPVKGCALVKSWTDVKRAIQQGYPVAVCSNQGFTMERDATGRARPQGVWNHCMAIIGVRSGPNEGGFILNSWGNSAHTGPVWPADAPVAGFWADATVIDRMVKQGDSFALADVAGFPKRVVPLDWTTVQAEPIVPVEKFTTQARVRDILRRGFAVDVTGDEYALAP